MNQGTIIALLAGTFSMACLLSFLFGRWLGAQESKEQLDAARVAMARSVHLAADDHAKALRPTCPTCNLYPCAKLPRPRYPALACHSSRVERTSSRVGSA